MKEITIKNSFLLLKQLAESKECRRILIQTDCSVTTDAIKQYATGIDAIRIRNSVISGSLEPNHRVLLDCQPADMENVIPNDLELYKGKNVSIVFIVGCDYDISMAPKCLETYVCRNEKAMTVGKLVDALETIEDKRSTAVYVNKGKRVGFMKRLLNSDSKGKYVQLQSEDLTGCPISEMIDFLKGFDRESMFCVIIDIDEIVYEVEYQKGSGQDAGTVLLHCVNAKDIAEQER